MTTLTDVTDRTVGELAAEVPTTIRIFEAWKIDYCCGGLTPLTDACAAAGKSVDDFIAELEKAAVVPDGSARDWRGDTLKAMATNIVSMYHEYTREELATLIPLANKVVGVHGHRRPELEDVVVLVAALAGDMLPHMLKEEQILFPYVGQLEAGDAPTPFFGTVKNPVRMMMLEHDRVGELLVSIREVTDDYALPEDACFSYRELYRRLAEFETRTHEHIHIENNLFFPRAIALEEEAGNTATFSTPVGAGTCGSGCSH